MKLNIINNIKILYYKLYNYYCPTDNKFTDFGVIPWYKILLGYKPKNQIPLKNIERYKPTNFWQKLREKNDEKG